MNKKPIIFRVSLNDKIFFARNLALLLKSGITLTEALVILKESTKSSSVRYILNEALKDIEKGQFLSNSLAKFSSQLDNFFISIIKVGELTGKLIENSERISIELRKIQRLKSKVISSLIYPSFIILTMFFIMFLVVYFLFPKLIPVFESLKVELPLTTRIFLKIAYFILNYGHFLFIGLIISGIGLGLALRNRKFRFYFDVFILNVPLLSSLFKKYSLASFSRNLAILLDSGVPIIESLNITSESLGNLFYKQKIAEAAEFVARGHGLEEFLNRYPKYFPYNFVKMITIGEKSGNLSNTLFYLAENLEEEIDIDLERFVNSLEPIILFVIAVMVGFIAISIITPIYEISDKLTR